MLVIPTHGEKDKFQVSLGCIVRLEHKTRIQDELATKLKIFTALFYKKKVAEPDSK